MAPLSPGTTSTLNMPITWSHTALLNPICYSFTLPPPNTQQDTTMLWKKESQTLTCKSPCQGCFTKRPLPSCSVLTGSLPTGNSLALLPRGTGTPELGLQPFRIPTPRANLVTSKKVCLLFLSHFATWTTDLGWSTYRSHFRRWPVVQKYYQNYHNSHPYRMPTCIQTTQTQLTTLAIHGETSCTWQDKMNIILTFTSKHKQWTALLRTQEMKDRKYHLRRLPEMNTWAIQTVTFPTEFTLTQEVDNILLGCTTVITCQKRYHLPHVAATQRGTYGIKQ